MARKVPAELQIGYIIVRLRWVTGVIAAILFVLGFALIYIPAGSYKGYDAGSWQNYYTYSTTDSAYQDYVDDINSHLRALRERNEILSILCLALGAVTVDMPAFAVRWSTMFDEGFSQSHPESSPQMQYLMDYVLRNETSRLHPGEEGITIQKDKQTIQIPIFTEWLNFPVEYLLRPGLESGIPGTPIDRSFVDSVRAWAQGGWKAKASLLLNGVRLSGGYAVPLFSSLPIPDYRIYAPMSGNQSPTAANASSVTSGSALPPRSNPKFCPQCGAALSPGAKFCAHCGHRL